MCYRVSIVSDIRRLMEYTGTDCLVPELFTPHYHLLGQQHPLLPVITCEDPNLIQACTWGFIPYFTKTEVHVKKFANMMLNARIDTLWEKASFKQAAQNKRCLILVDGFFEFHHLGKQKIPFYISRKDGMPMSIAGIYSNVTVEGIRRFTCSMVTQPADSGMVLGKIHNAKPDDGRTPYIIHPGCEGEWIANLPQGPIVQEFAALIDDEELQYWPVTDLLAKPAKYNADQEGSIKPVQYEGLNI